MKTNTKLSAFHKAVARIHLPYTVRFEYIAAEFGAATATEILARAKEMAKVSTHSIADHLDWEIAKHRRSLYRFRPLVTNTPTDS